MQVKVYATLRLKIGRATIDVSAGPGDTVRDALREVLEQYPVLGPHLMSDEGELVDHVHVFLNGRNVRLLDGLDTVIQEGQKLDIFPPVGGGNHLFPYGEHNKGVIPSTAGRCQGGRVSLTHQQGEKNIRASHLIPSRANTFSLITDGLPHNTTQVSYTIQPILVPAILDRSPSRFNSALVLIYRLSPCAQAVV